MIQSNVIFPYSYTTLHATVSKLLQSGLGIITDSNTIWKILLPRKKTKQKAKTDLYTHSFFFTTKPLLYYMLLLSTNS